jgi:hypothetical protein
MLPRMGALIAIVFMLMLALAGGASADVRYAAPGGSGLNPCSNPSLPCSLFTAADKRAAETTLASGDFVQMAPGTYSEAAGDLGPFGYVKPSAGVTIAGAPGLPRPLIEVESNIGVWGAFFIREATLSHLEIKAEAFEGSAVTMEAGVIEGVVARSTRSPAGACHIWDGTVRDSICLNEAGGVAIGADLAAFGGTWDIVLRNVTAIASGTGSIGADFAFYGEGVVANIQAKAVLVRGEKADVVARGLSRRGVPDSSGSSTTITLDHSDYATVETMTSEGGAASVTPPGTNGNITAPPLLASDDYHQLPGSPTIDKGAADESSGSVDIDGQLRAIGLAPDIGADELVSSDVASPSPIGTVPSPGSGDLAPLTRLRKHPRKRTTKRMAAFAFGSDEVGTRFECKLDRNPFRSCASPYRRKVNPGNHQFQVRAIDAQGKADSTPAVFRWRVVSSQR